MDTSISYPRRRLVVAAVVAAAVAMACVAATMLTPQNALAQEKANVQIIKMVTLKDYVAGGSVTKTFTYNSNGLVKYIKEKNKLGGGSDLYQHAYTYDKKNRITKIVTKSKKLHGKYTTKITLDKKGYAIKSTSSGPDNTTTTYRYNSKGQLIKAVQKGDNPQTTVFRYDKKGRLKLAKVTHPDGSVEKNTFKYNKVGQLSTASIHGITCKVKNTFNSIGLLDKQDLYYTKGGKKVKAATYDYSLMMRTVPVSSIDLWAAQLDAIMLGVVPLQTLR